MTVAAGDFLGEGNHRESVPTGGFFGSISVQAPSTHVG